MRLTPKESEIQKAILDYLSLKNIWHMRLNTGAMSGSHKGKRWFVKFGNPGMADILATMVVNGILRIYWIEVKRPSGKQSPAQLEFQREVCEQGHNYLVVESLDKLMAWIK